jgi:hypothetical protein
MDGYATCAAAVVIGFFHDGTTRRPRDETISRMIRPYIEGNSTEALSLVATEFKSYQFYTFRRGCYWDELLCTRLRPPSSALPNSVTLARSSSSPRTS